MSDWQARLAEVAAAASRPPEEVVWHHVLEGLLRRASRSGQAGALVLRGGLRTRMLVAPAPRPTRDADFLALFDCDRHEAGERLQEVLAAPAPDDGVAFDPASLRVDVIWQETPFPGVRALVRAGLGTPDEDVQIDLGFGDPLVPPAEWIDYPTLLPLGPARLPTCRAETLVGWKLHGLFEHGLRRWRPKDLSDLLLLTAHAHLELPDLVEGIRAAFVSRAEPLEHLDVLYTPEWWARPQSAERWARFRAGSPGQDVPADLPAVVAAVASALRPAVARLVPALGPDTTAG